MVCRLPCLYTSLCIKIKNKKMQDILIILIVYTLYSGAGFSNYIFYNLIFISSLIRNDSFQKYKRKKYVAMAKRSGSFHQRLT